MTEKIEREMRFTLTDEECGALIERIRAHRPLFADGYSAHELTVMFDNPNPELTFYSKAVDGRLRLRTITAAPGMLVEEAPPEICLLTWKQRLPDQAGDNVNTEREIEVPIAAESSPEVEAMLARVLHCPRVSSYERTRETLIYGDVEIAIDQFPYGWVVELELKHGDAVETLQEAAVFLNLPARRASQLSCDDMYRLLCQRAGVVPRNDISFEDDEMPRLNAFLESRA